ncbi:MAG TPA: hypothetical protein VN721_04505 [Flavipsychrobacter sp.]|nr:hypothetical protein [Flavipsychrobacter sp.]
MAKLTQDQLVEIFNTLKKELKPYEKGSIVARMDIEGKYDLWSEHKNKMLIHDKMRNEVNFATLIIQSNYVGFYYMPIYSNCNDLKDKLSAGLMSKLKGKACFHIKEINKDVISEVNQAMKLGYEQYKKNGWVK